ncbi:putative mitochondrial protein, partial [Mucuna pruriens]
MPIALRKGKRSCVSFITTIDAIKTPASVQEAIKDSNWVQTMREEMKALERNSTWDIVDKPKDNRVVACRWICIVKCKSDGTLDQYKARLLSTLLITQSNMIEQNTEINKYFIKEKLDGSLIVTAHIPKGSKWQ